MLSDERINTLACEVVDGYSAVESAIRTIVAEGCFDAARAMEKAIRAAVAEAVAENDKAWQWQLDNPDSMADMMKAAHARMAIERAVIAAREEEEQ